MSLDPLWDFLTSSWVGDIIGVIDDVIRVIPYTLLFFLAFLIVQGLIASHAAVDMGAGPAARALVHGAFLDTFWPRVVAWRALGACRMEVAGDRHPRV